MPEISSAALLLAFTAAAVAATYVAAWVFSMSRPRRPGEPPRD